MRHICVVALFFVVACGGGTGGNSTNPPPTVNPPAAPTGLTATGGNGEIDLAWIAVSGATGYVVLGGDASGASKVQLATASGTTFADTGLGQGATRFYVVRSVGPGGTSGDSTEATATSAVEPAPLHLAAIGGKGEIALSWDAVAGATGYVVLRGDASGDARSPIANPADNAFVDTGLGQGASKFYVVRAVGPAGTSSDSAEVNATTQAQAAPIDLTARARKGAVSLAWTAAPEATSYVIRRSVGGGTPIQAGTTSALTFDDGNLQNGASYRYTVRAVGPLGESADSTAAVAVPFRSICVSNSQTNEVLVLNAEGSTTQPLRRFGSITGANTLGIGLDPVHGEIFSANAPETVTAYAEDANGNVAPLRTLTFPGRGQPLDVAYDAQDDQILVATVLGTVATYDRSASGEAVPVRTLFTPAIIGAVALSGQAHGDHLFVFDSRDTHRILIYGRTDVDFPAPAAIVTMPESFIILSIAYDPVSDELLVGGVDTTTQQGAVMAVAPVDGPATPARSLEGPSTGLKGGVTGIAVDPASNLLYVVDQLGQVLTFARAFGLGADQVPLSTLAGSLTRLPPTNSTFIRIDPSRGRLVTVAGENSTLLVFDASAHGNTAPLNAVGSGASGVDRPGGLAFDAANDQLFVANQAASGATVTAYSAESASAVVPLRTLATHAGGFAPNDVRFDAGRGELIVAQGGLRQVAFYARTAANDTTALRTIEGANTRLAVPNAVALDEANDSLVVVDSFSSLLRFPRTFASGDQPPLNAIAGPDTALFAAVSVSIDDLNGEIFVANHQAITVHRLTDNGNVAPLRILDLENPFVSSVLVDQVASEMFVVSLGDLQTLVRVFARTASGHDAPIREIFSQTNTSEPLELGGLAFCN